MTLVKLLGLLSYLYVSHCPLFQNVRYGGLHQLTKTGLSYNTCCLLSEHYQSQHLKKPRYCRWNTVAGCLNGLVRNQLTSLLVPKHSLGWWKAAYIYPWGNNDHPSLPRLQGVQIAPVQAIPSALLPVATTNQDIDKCRSTWTDFKIAL